jgi:hypothetical protein
MERRSAKRYPAVYPLETGTSYMVSRVNMFDISTSGVSFASGKDLGKNTAIQIKLFLKSRMFPLEAIVVRSRKLKEGLYNIGVTFIDPPAEFEPVLSKEIDEIVQHHRERRLYQRDDISFTHASREYLDK